MKTKAAPLTPAGPGGVAIVQISGPDAQSIISRIFRPLKKNPDARSNTSAANDITFSKNKLYFGAIIDGDDTVDQVIISVDPQNYTAQINCHGGPRIIQRLLMLLQKQNVEITAWDKLAIPASIADEVDDSEKARQMVLDDLTTVCNALGTLIHLANTNKYVDAKTASKMCVEFLQQNFGSEGEPDENPETPTSKEDK